MYTPKYFAETDEENLLAFMREFNFAVLVSTEDGLPTATHLPFIMEKRGDKIILSAHMARANPQWKLFAAFADSDVLVIFQEPHAYVSPLLYTQLLNVPHAYGKVKLFETVEENIALLEKMIAAFDPEYLETNWREIPDEYKASRAGAIVAFEIEVTGLQGKKKLNQNKGREDAENVIAAFEKSERPNERQIARFMKEIYDK